MNKHFKPILLTLLALVALTFTSCKDDESGTDGPNTSTGTLSDAVKAKLYEKTWYTGKGIDFIFFEDGTFRLNQSLDGTWKWINNSDTMLVTNYDNAKYRNVFMSVSDNAASYRSDQGNDNFKTVVNLSTSP